MITSLKFRSLTLTLLALGALARVQAAPAHPNVIFIMTDDQSQWGVGAYGNKEIVTPNLDKLAREGVLLRHAFVTTPVCSASRATYLTGLYSTQTGIPDYLASSEEKAGFGLPAAATTWPQVLQRNGYVTGLIGKWHLGIQPQFHPTKHGFDHFFGFVGGFNTPMNPTMEENGTLKQFKGPISDIMTDDAMRFVATNRARPFALLLHFREPHLPYGPMPEEDMAPFKGRDLTVPEHVGVDTAKTKELRRAYYAAVHAVDRNVGRLLAKLDELGLARDTIVVFTGDNGYMIGQHALHTKGNAWWLLEGIPPNTKRPNMYEDSLRVPFIVRWPGAIPAGSQTTEPYSSVDTFATMLGLMGISIPSEVKQEGADYSPLLRGQKIPWGDAMFAQYDLKSGGLAYMRMIRTDRWKLVRHYLSLELDELYDLQNDPGEERNLYNAKPAAGKTSVAEAQKARAQLQERLYAWQRKINDPLLAQLATERDPAKR